MILLGIQFLLYSATKILGTSKYMRKMKEQKENKVVRKSGLNTQPCIYIDLPGTMHNAIDYRLEPPPQDGKRTITCLPF